MKRKKSVTADIYRAGDASATARAVLFMGRPQRHLRAIYSPRMPAAPRHSDDRKLHKRCRGREEQFFLLPKGKRQPELRKLPPRRKRKASRENKVSDAGKRKCGERVEKWTLCSLLGAADLVNNEYPAPHHLRGGGGLRSRRSRGLRFVGNGRGEEWGKDNGTGRVARGWVPRADGDLIIIGIQPGMAMRTARMLSGSGCRCVREVMDGMEWYYGDRMSYMLGVC